MQMKQKVTEQEEGKRVRVPGLPEFITEIDSEASDTESPYFENVATPKYRGILLVG